LVVLFAFVFIIVFGIYELQAFFLQYIKKLTVWKN